MTINGTYTLEKNENLEGFLASLGLKDEKVQQMASLKPTMTVNMAGGKLDITSKVGDHTVQNSLTLGSTCKYTFSSGFELDINLTISGNTGKGTIQRGERTGEITIEFGDSHVTETFTIGGKSCKRVYKRT